MRGFMLGLVVGGVVGAFVGVTLGPKTPAEPSASVRDGEARADPETRPMLASEETAPPRLANLDRDVQAAETPAAPASPGETQPTSEAAARRRRVEELRAELRALASEEAGAPAVVAFLTRTRTRMQGTDQEDAAWAGRALVRLADAGKLTAEQVEALAADYGRAPAGQMQRRYLASAVALAWAKDARLAGWLRELPTDAEPEVRTTVVEALDESPSAAYRAYLLNLSKTERNADVLDEVWNEDPIGVALTRAFAPSLIEAIAARIGERDLPAKVRGRGIFAIGLAALYDDDAAQKAISTLAWEEPDKAVKVFAQEVLAAIGRGEANVQALEGIWHRHRGGFGSP
jgi:hypothetical protein